MRKHAIPVFLILLLGLFPLQILALAFYPQLVKLVPTTHERLELKLFSPVGGLRTDFQIPEASGRVSASAAVPVREPRTMRIAQYLKMRRQYNRKRPEISEQNRHERAAAAWGAASLFSSIVFITAGLLASSLLVYAFCLLAIPFGVLAFVQQKKARALGSKRKEGQVMGIVGMSIAGLGVTFLALLLIAWLLWW
jgi:hypothetical protein